MSCHKILIVKQPHANLPSDIIDCLTNNCDRKDKAQRSPIGVEISNLKLRYELAQGHDQEKHVEEELELVVQDLKAKSVYLNV